MAGGSYPRDRTALLFVDPYNDFLSEGGKLWPYVREVAEQVKLLDNLRAVTAAIRTAGIPVFIVQPHRWETGAYEGWDHQNTEHIAWGQMQNRSENSQAG